MVVRTTKSPRVFAINPEQNEIDINKRIPELQKILKDNDLKLMLALVKDEREVIETIFVQVKQEAMAEAENEPNDGTEVVAMDEERLDMIHVKDFANVITKLAEKKPEIEFDDFYDYFQSNFAISTLSNYFQLTYNRYRQNGR